jgi:N-acetylglucosaminyl-diphospho-decaprenol L-rhamnosyltransferase
MTVHVAIAIVGFRNANDIGRCLDAVGRSTFADYTVIICENGGAEAFSALEAGARGVLPGGQPVSLIRAPGNVGFAGGVNICLQAAPNADAYWILNPDTEVEPGALAAMVARLQVGDCDAVGSVLAFGDGTVQAFGGRWRPWLARAEGIGRGLRVGAPIDAAAVEREQSFIMGASLLASRRFVEVAGAMREDYFLYGEETEWCLRAIRLGLKLGFAPDAVVQHHQGATTGSGESAARRPRLPVYLDERNKMLMTRDSFPGRLPVAAVAALALLFLRYGIKGRGAALRHAVDGWWAGLRNERGRPSFASA